MMVKNTADNVRIPKGYENPKKDDKHVHPLFHGIPPPPGTAVPSIPTIVVAFVGTLVAVPFPNVDNNDCRHQDLFHTTLRGGRAPHTCRCIVIESQVFQLNVTRIVECYCL